jgi:hypothetical protein
MARRMPQLEKGFASAAEEALRLAEAGEHIRAISPANSQILRELTIRRLEALYETSYLRIFLFWEDFLEQSFLRYLCGYESTTGPAVLRVPKFSTLAGAQLAILGNRKYITWANHKFVVQRAQHFVNAGFHEIVLNSNLARLEAFQSIRDRIAHRSEYARRQFDGATVSLVGRRFPASSPGKFLRHTAIASPVPKSWLQHIAIELKSLAVQICP